MQIDFSGAATPLVPSDYTAAAQALGCDEAAIHAVRIVEVGTTSGFLSDGSGRPRILFEALHFGNETQHQYDRAYPNISVSSPDWSLYRDGAAEYLRLDQAVALDFDAALRSTSWGLFQILGENCHDCGFGDAKDYVAAICESERAQLDAFVAFVKANRMDGALAERDWTTFALRYNGPLEARNNYASRLQQAYTDYATWGDAPPPPLRQGSTGDMVRKLQDALDGHGNDLQVDGQFGRATYLAVMRFQQLCNLTVDGIAGPSTLALLGVHP
jgi:peptidoglycan hydrolase-like protein with peptidoglycan-binding domain